MQPCKLDLTRSYALALEGGGAKGSYEVGVWECLAEEGVRIRAVSGTSVGALNGAFVAMGELAQAKALWQSLRCSQVMRVDDAVMKKLLAGDLLGLDLPQTAATVRDVLRGGGFDIAPLQQLMATYIDERRVRESPVDLYMVTFSLSDLKVMELRAKDLPQGTLHDMLLASAYLPGFRNEKLGGKRYVDGGVADNVPLHALIENNCTDIIAVRVFGYGVYRPIRIPADVRVTFVAPSVSLGHTLDFDPARAARNLKLGYFDAKRTLHGLCGSRYYIDRQLTEAEAYELMRSCAADYFRAQGRALPLRLFNERLLPRLAARLKASGDYHACFLAALEAAADEAGIDPFCIRTERQLLSEASAFFSPAEGRLPAAFGRLFSAVS